MPNNKHTSYTFRDRVRERARILRRQERDKMEWRCPAGHLVTAAPQWWVLAAFW
ncbi:hypothetical protein HanIR_Chr09g0396191 [Helianthus annuus]|nr:hypothetical protein HanIR_Chr09g0396191 [Helianthus annuus]